MVDGGTPFIGYVCRTFVEIPRQPHCGRYPVCSPLWSRHSHLRKERNEAGTGFEPAWSALQEQHPDQTQAPRHQVLNHKLVIRRKDSTKGDRANPRDSARTRAIFGMFLAPTTNHAGYSSSLQEQPPDAVRGAATKTGLPRGGPSCYGPSNSRRSNRIAFALSRDNCREDSPSRRAAVKWE